MSIVYNLTFSLTKNFADNIINAGSGVPPIVQWILEFGIWNDMGYWIDTATWND